jgi:processive 1,2-diacylglycerol beta-glucosyltransferase
LGSVLASSFQFTTHHIAVITDYRTVPTWPIRGVNLYCVSSYPASLDLLKRGLNFERVLITGIPLRQQFSEEKTTKSKGIAGKFLLMTGGLQSTPYSNVSSKVTKIAIALGNRGHEATIICGKNNESEGKISENISKAGLIDKIKIVGYIESIASIINKHDVVIAKPGGLICAESTALGKPLILIERGYGQEKGNIDYLVNGGAALELTSTQKIPQAISVFENKKTFTTMSQNSKRIGNKNSTKEIVKQILKRL